MCVQVHGTTCYTAQDPWIQNCSLQDNILMGLPFEQEHYEQVLQACALLPDLALLPAGDQTEIGMRFAAHSHIASQTWSGLGHAYCCY